MQLHCGAGKACITPDRESLPYMSGLGKAKFGTIHDELYVRALLFDNQITRMLFISFDLDKAPDPEKYIKLLAERAQIPEENILIIGIHTHTAPLTGYRPYPPAHDITKKPKEVQKVVKEYEDQIKEKVLEAVDQAVKELRPVRMGGGFGSSYINANRCQRYEYLDGKGRKRNEMAVGSNGIGPVDHKVFVAKFEDMQGKEVAFFINYAVHGTVMFLNNWGNGLSAISGDIGGNTSQCIEELYPGSVAMWSSGAAGDICPIFATQMFYPDEKNGKPIEQRIQTLQDSEILLNILVGRHTADIRSVIETIICEETNMDIAAAVDVQDGIRLHLMLLGNTGFLGVNGELYSSLGSKICESVPIKNMVVVNHDSSLSLPNPGYIYDDNTIQRCKEADVNHLPGASDIQRLGRGTDLVKRTKDLYSYILSHYE